MKRIICLFIMLSLTAGMEISVRAENAEAACVIEAQTGRVVYEKNSVARLPMASTTKIMTCITAIEACNLDDVVTVSHNAAYQEGSSAYLGEGYEITMRDLLYGLMLNSGNDAAVAVAEHVSGSVEEFADLMNEKAAEIGLGNTNFTNPNGLPDDEHYTSAYDLAVITSYALRNDAFREIVSSYTHSADIINSEKPLDFKNHNKLLRSYDGCIGVKTGFTKAAGRCLVSAAERDGITFIAVTLNDPDDWKDHRELLDNAFSRYSMVKIISGGEQIPYPDYNIVYGSDMSVPVENGGHIKTKVELHIPKNLKAPVTKGEKIGYVEIKEGSELLGKVDVCMGEDLYADKKSDGRFFRKFRHIFDRLLL